MCFFVTFCVTCFYFVFHVFCISYSSFYVMVLSLYLSWFIMVLVLDRSNLSHFGPGGGLRNGTIFMFIHHMNGTSMLQYLISCSASLRIHDSSSVQKGVDVWVIMQSIYELIITHSLAPVVCMYVRANII